MLDLAPLQSLIFLNIRFFVDVLKTLWSEKYTNLSIHLDEIGRMLGSWKKGLETKTPTEIKLREKN